MGSKYPNVYLISKFPNLDIELRKYLPPGANLVVMPLPEKLKNWTEGIILSSEQMTMIKDAEVLVIDSMYLSEMLYKLPKAKWVQTTWAGVELLASKMDKTKPLNFKLTRYVDTYFGELMSNYVIGQIINLERGFYVYRDKQNTHEWARPFFPDFRVLSELTIGVLGAGNLGSSVGGLLKKAGSRVIVLVRNPRPSPSDFYDEATTDLKYVLEQCDYICNVLPSTEETRGLLDSDVLKYCKKKPVFMNVGRGDIIKAENIVKALKEGWISRAVLDVFDKEPLPPDHFLWSTEEVYISPHVGGIPKIAGIAKFIANNYARYVDGEMLENEVDLRKGY